MWTFIATKAPGRPLARSADSPTSCSPESRVRRRLSPARAGAVAERPARAAERVHLDPLTAGGAAQEPVVGVLDAGLADDVAGLEAAGTSACFSWRGLIWPTRPRTWAASVPSGYLRT